MSLNLNPHKGEGSNGEMKIMPIGVYLVSIEEVKYKKSKSSGKDMFEISYRVIEGPEGSDKPKDFKNRKLFEFFVTTVDFHMGNLYNLCVLCDISEAKRSAIDENYKDLIGKVLKVRVGQQPREDKPNTLTNKIEPGSYLPSATKPVIPDNIAAAVAAPSAPPPGAALPFSK